MENNKIKKEINDVVNDNLKALEQLFPSAVKDGQLDIKALKEELGDFEEVTTENYELNWSGKQNAKKIVQQGIGNKTLKFVEKDSKNADTTENIYIEGDNLEVLKLLRQNYYNSIKMIYIDPPYNTGNDFVYNDTFKMDKEESDKAEGIISENNEKLQKNQKSTNRYHANWLNMMYPRLKLARDLLTDDGVIFISIDDNEQANLKRLCDEIFGEENFVGEFTWLKKKKGSHLSKTVRNMTEYLICFSKNRINVELFGEKAYSDKQQPLAKRTNSLKKLVFPKNFINTTLSEGKYTKGIYGKGTSSLNFEEFNVRDGLVNSVCEVIGPFIWTQEKLDEEINLGTTVSLSSKFGFNVLRYNQDNKIKRPSTMIDSKVKVGTNEDAYEEIKEIFEIEGIMDYPKPVSLINYVVNTVTFYDKDSLILDFFSGSATTAHAVMQLNSEDNGNRKYIMVQLPETTDEKSEAFKAGYKNIAEIGKERIRRAGEKIKQEIEEYNSNLKLGEEPKKVPDIGFKVFKVGDTNIKWYDLDNFNEESQYSFDDPDSLDFVLGSNDIDIVYEIMLRQNDVPLSESLEVLTDIGNRTYLYASTYLICLETEITEEMVEKLASLEPLPIKFIFRDSAFKDNISLKDETFRKLRSLIERNSGESKVSYRVEFI